MNEHLVVKNGFIKYDADSQVVSKYKSFKESSEIHRQYFYKLRTLLDKLLLDSIDNQNNANSEEVLDYIKTSNLVDLLGIHLINRGSLL